MKPRQIDGFDGYEQRSRGRSDGVAPLPPSIVLSNATVADTASVGDTIGTLSVINGQGTYTFTLTSDLFAIDTPRLKVGAALSAGSDPITVHADNGAGSTVDGTFTITVT